MRGAATEQQRVGRELTPSSSITSSSYDVLTEARAVGEILFLLLQNLFLVNQIESMIFLKNNPGEEVKL
jgi:hypothetical protein